MRRKEIGFDREVDGFVSEKNTGGRSCRCGRNHLLVSSPVRDVRRDAVRLGETSDDNHQEDEL